jgi:DNA replication initiation complex subunit (GINS family)
MEQTLSYETLYEIFRNEKNREDIQELSPTFYSDVVLYLNKNKETLDKALENNNFSEDEKEDLVRQIKNIKNLIREIYDRRETKIMNLALNFARTKTESIEFQSLLPQEKEFYKMCIETFDVFRKKNLEKTLRGSISVDTDFKEKNYFNKNFSKENKNNDFEDKKNNLQDKENDLQKNKNNLEDKENDLQKNKNNLEDKENNLEDKENNLEDNIECVTDQKTNNIKNNENETIEQDSTHDSNQDNLLKIKFKEFVPKFLGKELEIYGPFESGDVADLPIELANILLKKEKAEEFNN